MRHFIQTIAIVVLMLMSFKTMPAQAQVTKKVYPYYMIPKENPDYNRHSAEVVEEVCSPSSGNMWTETD